MDLPQLADKVPSEKHIRIREKIHSGFFGRIFRESNKTLKQHNIKDRSSLVIQILDEAEELGHNTFVLLFSKRNVVDKVYEETR